MAPQVVLSLCSTLLELFLEPTTIVGHNEAWTDLDPRDGEFGHLLERIRFLQDRGLTVKKFVFDYTKRCLAPLQERFHTAWLYWG
jgi:hypothetical protein